VLGGAGDGRARRAAGWVLTELLGRQGGAPITTCPIAPAMLGELVALVDDGTISGRTAKDVLGLCWAGEGSPAEIVEARGLRQVSDTGPIDEIIAAVLAEHPRQLEALRAGKDNLKGFFVGQIMKRSRGQANPKLVAERLDLAIAKDPS
jgi:aspartyl-tRNA(Asn)/glutamyl-tRNA(Gln) amidotransferase subunit B